jgi:hypothetical protein
MAATALLLGSLLGVMAVAACGGGHPMTAPPSSSAAPGSLPPAGPGLALPAQGAVLGAWVAPTGDYTPAGYISAAKAFEEKVGDPVSVLHNYHVWTSPFPNAFDTWVVSSGHTLLLSWATTDTLDVVSGKEDALITERARALAALKGPVLLEYRWEMDRPNLASVVHGPAEYIKAWDHVHALFRAAGATNVGFVFCPTAVGFTTHDAAAYYPGDDEVDWLCVDAYAGPHYVPLSTTLAPFLAWASHHPKPIFIGEIGADVDGAGDQASWIRALLTEAPKMPQVRGYFYFDAVFTDRNDKTTDISIDTPASIAAFHALQTSSFFHLPPESTQ